MQRHDIENTVQVPFLSGLADHGQIMLWRSRRQVNEARELEILKRMLGEKSRLHSLTRVVVCINACLPPEGGLAPTTRPLTVELLPIS
jgi:hypothetical protein